MNVPIADSLRQDRVNVSIVEALEKLVWSKF